MAQNTSKIDSLLKSLESSNDNTIKINLLNELAETYLKKGIDYYYTGKYKIALQNFDDAIKYYKETDNEKGISACYNNIGSINFEQGSYLIALEYYQKALKIRKELNYKSGIASCLNNIGETYRKQTDYTQALQYYKHSLEIYTELNIKYGISAVFLNIGNVYQELKYYDKAHLSFKKSLKLKQELDDKAGIATCYNNIGGTYFLQKKHVEAMEYLNKSLKINIEIDFQSLIAENFRSIARIYFEKKDYKKAIYYTNKSLAISTKLNEKESSLKSYELLSEIYSEDQNYKEAYFYSKKHQNLKDNVFSTEKAKEITKIHMEYLQLQKDEIELLKQEKKEQEYQLKLNRERNLRYTFIGGLLFLSILVILIFRSNNEKKKANKLLNQKNTEINQQKEEIEAQRDLANAQKEEIIASITYAEKIQRAILPSKNLFEEILSEHFVLFTPKDIVSGDFYWIKKIKNFVIIATADCTGHGVPGAFMSMLGSSFLSEIVTTRRLDSSGKILDSLRTKIKKTLHQTEGGAQDGMDISLYIMDLETLELQYSGAYNSLYIVRNQSENKNSEINNENIKYKDKLIELKANRQPIARFIKETEFSTTIFQLKKDDQLYTFSDGYADQFGGEHESKFMSKRFKKLLVDINNKTMIDQKNILEKTFDNWKGNLSQIDDVLVIGVKI